MCAEYKPFYTKDAKATNVSDHWGALDSCNTWTSTINSL